MRKGTWKRMKEWLSSFKSDHKGENRPMGFGGWLCFAARALGSVVFTLSCCTVFLPFALGFTWIETIIVMAVGLFIAGQFLSFHRMFFEVEAFVLYIWDKMVRNRTWCFYWAQDPENPNNR